jgi:4-cresol dehydrogenase (hydroxylating)
MADNFKVFKQQAAKAGVMLTELQDRRILAEALGVAGPLPEQTVRPQTEMALASVVKAASQNKIPVWVAWNATGNALQVGRGEGQPVLLDLSRMNKIVELNADTGYALVEPGVSYNQLAKQLSARGHGYLVDAGRDDDESILGGVVDKSFGYTPYGDRVMMQCGMEVMQANGELMRTGMGALSKQNTWQLFKYGFGPYKDGIFMQSSLVVPTKMGVWLCPQPPRYKPFAIRIDSDVGYAAAVDLLCNLRVNQVVPNNAVAIDGDSEKAMLNGDNIAAWNVYGAFYGIPKVVDFLWRTLNGAVAGIKDTKLEDLEGNHNSPRGFLMAGKPAPSWKNFMEKQQGRYLRLVFALPIDGQLSLDFVNQTKQAARAAGFEVTIEQVTAWRALLPEVLLTVPVGKERDAVACGTTLIQKWGAQGVGVVRASPALMPASLASYSEGGYQTLVNRLSKSFAA